MQMEEADVCNYLLLESRILAVKCMLVMLIELFDNYVNSGC